MKNLLVTGGAGFIGSNFIHFMLNSRREISIVNLDALTYAGNLENLNDIEQDPRYVFIKGSIRDSSLLNRLFAEYQIDTVVHFAAESHVDRSILDAAEFLNTNILGTQTLLEAARKNWSLCPDDVGCDQYRHGTRFLQISTDEVYGALGREGKFSETSPLLPNSPYSASKAGADMIVRAYHETYGLPINITRCSNNYGSFQFPEKLIPLTICNALRDEAIPIYGDGRQTRDWIHVLDHCSAIAAVLERGMNGEVYNIGADEERTNLEIVRLLLKEMGKPEDRIAYIRDRPGHDRRYAIDHSKITAELNWHPLHDFKSGIRETVQWYLKHQDWIHHITTGEYQKYYEKLYKKLSI